MKLCNTVYEDKVVEMISYLVWQSLQTNGPWPYLDSPSSTPSRRKIVAATSNKPVSTPDSLISAEPDLLDNFLRHPRSV